MSVTITAGHGPYEGLTNAALQRAVDAAAKAGGVVEIPAGVYQMHDALHLRSGVTIVGESGTVLQKVPSVSSALKHLLGYGHYEFIVEEPEKFRPGMGVLLSDNNAFGFYTTAATITGRQGELLFIDRPLAHDYNPAAGGQVTSVFALVSGIGVHGAAVKNIVLDGNPAESVILNGCRGGGVFLHYSHNFSMEGVTVRHFNGDAISFQACTDVLVSGCHLHDNAGTGLHPGSGSVRYLMRGNRVENNGGCGIFYCLRTKFSISENNLLKGNKRDGISVGERDTDHILRGNEITGNHGAGIHLREPLVESGDRLWIEGNVLGGNNLDGDFAEFYVSQGLRDVCFTGNVISSGGGPAFAIKGPCTGISIAGNQINGRDQETRDVPQVEGVRNALPAYFPAVGPEATPLDAARHIQIEKLPERPPW